MFFSPKNNFYLKELTIFRFLLIFNDEKQIKVVGLVTP